MKVINNRYNIIESLARESNGTVFLVEDQMNNNKRLRLKLFNIEFSKSQMIERIFNDFLKLKGVFHPNLFSIYSFSSVTHINGKSFNKLQYFYTFEDYDLSELKNYRTLSRNESVSVIIELFKVMRFLNFRGINYTYVNFENLYIFKRGDQVSIKLENLVGLMQYEEYSTFKSNANIQFLAPEIIWGEERDHTSDIYSLGAMVYFLYYREDYKVKKLESYTNIRNRSEIYDLIKKATSNFKEERFESIQEMFEVVQKTFWVTYDEDDYKYYNVLNFKTPLIGHKRLVRDVLKSKKESLINFSGMGYLLYGKRGSGKSRILKEFNQRFLFQGEYVKYYQIKEKLKENQWIESLIKSLINTGNVTTEMIQKYGPEILKLLPEYGKVWDMVPSQPLSDEKEHYRLINRLYNFLLEYSTLNPFILMIDDIHYMNKMEYSIIGNLVKHSKEAPIFIMLSIDDYELNRAVNWSPVEDIHFEEVTAFNLEETGEFIQRILGMGHVPYGVAIPVMDEASGNPRIIEEIIRTFYLEDRLKVSKKPTWQLDKEKPIVDIDIKYDENVANTKLVENLNSDLLEVLKKLSGFKENFNQKLYSLLIEDEDNQILDDLVNLNIVSKKLTDNEYVYSYTSKNLKRYFYQKLSSDEKTSLHENISKYLKKWFRDEKSYSEELTYHLIQSENYEAAADFYQVLADEAIEFHRYKDAITKLKEVARLNDLIGESDKSGQAFFKIGEFYIMFSMLDEALFVFEKALSRFSQKENQLRCQVKIGHIKILMNKLTEANETFEKVQVESSELMFSEGEYEAVCNLARIKNYRGDYQGYRETVVEHLDRAVAEDKTYYIGRLQSELAIIAIYDSNNDEALKYFTSALKNFESSNSNLDTIKTMNNLGVFYVNAFSDLEKAKDYFVMSIDLLKAQNLSDGMSTYLYNLSEILMIEEEYEKAYDYMNQAMKFSEDSGDKNVLYPIINGLALLHCRTFRFDDASIAINRLEHEFSYFKDRDLDVKDYYYSQMTFFTKIKHLEMAEKWRKLYADAIGDFEEFRFALLNFQIGFTQKNLFKFSKEIDFETIDRLKEQADQYLDRKLVRNMILDLALDLLYSKKFLIIQKLLVMENSIEEDFVLPVTDIKRKIVQGFLEEERISYYKSLLLKEDIPDHLKWVTYKLIGDEYFATNDYYNALMYYMMSFDIIRLITMKIPQIYREPFIVYDENKLELKNKIYELRLKLVGDVRKLGDGQRGIEVNSFEDFFDTRYINELYNHPNFMKTLYDNYEIKYGNRLESVDDVVKNFKGDAKLNFRLILQYFEQLTISERGFIYIFDDHDEIVETIKSDEVAEAPDLLQFMKNITKGDEGIIVNSLYDEDYLLMDHQKGLIAFPIMAHSKNEKKIIENRKSDGKAYKEKILGYVYLETGTIFNNFTEDAYRKCVDLLPMLRVMITNFNLRRVSTVDKLTTVYLRKFIEEMFSQELHKARYDESHLSVIMCDIDKFKDVNDTYGHRKGDAVLNSIGKILKSSLRATDMVGRYGGEEFILILPKTTKHDAFEVSEKIRNTIQKSNLLGNEVAVTMSFGVSTYPEDGQYEEELIEKADKSLYYSKNSGRNRTTLWNKDLLMKNERFDKLAGILTGNVSADARNVQAIIDLFDLLRVNENFEEKILKLLTTLLDITESMSATIVSGPDLDTVYTRVRGLGQLTDQLMVDKLLLKEYMEKDAGSYFINWDDLTETSIVSNGPNWNSVIITPLTTNGIKRGLLLLTVPINEKEFDFNAFNFVNVLSGVIGSIIEMEE